MLCEVYKQSNSVFLNGLRIHYCGFGQFCSTGHGTKLLLSILLLTVLIYHISIKRQILRLSNDIDNIKMVKRILLKINYEIEKSVFLLNSLTIDILLNNLFKPLKLYKNGVKVWIEGTMSQIFFRCPHLLFMKSRKKCFENTLKVSRFFSNKIKTRA